MGAITFCPELPFQVHAMSSLPILKESLYDGPAFHRNLDHVVFPISLLMDDDEDYVLLSFGLNDRYGAISKMHIAELLDSLTEVNACGR